MPRWDADGGRMVTTLFEAAAYQHTIRATCRGCGHTAVLHPHALWWRFLRKGWDDRLPAATARFRCLRCGKGRVGLATTRDPVTHDKLPMPPAHEWKRAVNRFRN